MTNGNLISAFRNMVDDIENLGAAPMTVDVSVLRQAIAALTPPEGYVLVPVEPTVAMVDALYQYTAYDVDNEDIRLRQAYSAMLAARPEVK